MGLTAVLCAHGLAAQRSTNKSKRATAGAEANLPGAAQAGTAQTGQAMMLERTSQLIGKEVKDPQGQNLGVIHDIVLTPDFQQISYVALSSGGVFGAGKTLHAIPWQALHVGLKGEITLNATAEQLKQSPGFANDNWPSEGNSRWLSAAAGAAGSATMGSQAAAGQSAAGAPSAPMGSAATADAAVQMRRVTHLTGMEVKNPENQDLGDIEDFAVDVSNGRIIYDIVAFGGVAGVGEKFAAVPADAVRLEAQTHVALLNATPKTLESATFNPAQLASLGNPQEMKRLSEMFPAAPGASALGYVPPEPQAQLVADEKAWGPEGPHTKAFNPSAARTITGTVESVGGFRPEGAPAGVSPGLRLRIKTAEGRTMTVQAGPAAYAERQDFFVMPGDRITISGSETKIGTRTVIIASEIKKGPQTLRLRDESGRPLWTMAPRRR